MSRTRNAVSPLFAFLAIGAVISGANAKPPSRIWGGRRATVFEFGGAVSLSYPGEFFHICGAAIIGPRHVLTAAHCVADKSKNDISIRAGIHDIRDRTNVVERLVSRVIIRPDYISYIEGKRHVQNDLAILVLQTPLPLAPFGGRIHKFNLPTQQPEEGRTFFLSGWGQNHHTPTNYQFELKVLNMTLGEEKRCDGFVPQTLCGFGADGSVCAGDSGSPVTRGGYLYGITSTSRCEVDDPAHFVNVYYFLDWINVKMRQYP